MKLFKTKYRESDGSIAIRLDVGNNKEDVIKQYNQYRYLCSGLEILTIDEVDEINGHKIIVQ